MVLFTMLQLHPVQCYDPDLVGNPCRLIASLVALIYRMVMMIIMARIKMTMTIVMVEMAICVANLLFTGLKNAVVYQKRQLSAMD